jgi:hypothetical protein
VLNLSRVNGECNGQPVDLAVGQVAVIEKTTFCEIAACAGRSFPECGGIGCPPGQTYCGTVGNCGTCPLAEALCLCGGGPFCRRPDAILAPGTFAFEDGFDDPSNPSRWHLASSQIDWTPSNTRLVIGSADPLLEGAVADAAVRFPLSAGESYVLFVKHSIVPAQASAQCDPYGFLGLFLATQPATCDTDGDGSPLDVDCNDWDPDVHTGTPDAVCDGVDDDCDATPDDQYVGEPDRWTPTSTTGAPAPRDGHTLVTFGAGPLVLVWGGQIAGALTNTGGIYDVAADTWTSFTLSTTIRRDHTAVVADTGEMIVWGGVTFPAGFLNTGVRYAPGSGTQSPTSTTGAPTGRAGHTAIAIGSGPTSAMIVWGGIDASGRTNTGGIYSPSSNTWTSMSTIGAPTARAFHTAVWTGTEMIVWGGEVDAAGSVTNTGGRYNPSTNTWVALPTSGAPTARKRHTAIWNGSDFMIVWGGENSSGSPMAAGGRYWRLSNLWIAGMSNGGAPAARSSHTAVWDGTLMTVWGGRSSTGAALDTGGSYSPSANTWRSTTATGVPEARTGAAAAWVPVPGKMLVWGGLSGAVRLDSGGRYDPRSACGTGECRRDAGTRCTYGRIGFGCTPGSPNPEVCNGLDDDCNGSVDNGVPPVSGSPSLTLRRVPPWLEWTPLPSAMHYDCARGGVGTLRASAGDFTVSTTQCVVDNETATAAADPDLPSAGDGFWYLVRGGNTCSGPGTYNSGSPRQVGSRDGEVIWCP